MQRQIVRDPPCPGLTARGEQAIETLCFGSNPHTPPSCDVMLVTGSAHSVDRLVNTTGQLLRTVEVRTVVVTGGTPRFTDSKHRTETESEEILRLLDMTRFPMVEVIEEPRATNLKENVEFSRILLREVPRSMIVIAKSHSMGRAEATVRASFPNTRVAGASFDADFGAGTLSRATWKNRPEHRARVWGEFLRLKEYGGRGDIGLTEEQRDLIRIIEGELLRK